MLSHSTILIIDGYIRNLSKIPYVPNAIKDIIILFFGKSGSFKYQKFRVNLSPMKYNCQLFSINNTVAFYFGLGGL